MLENLQKVKIEIRLI